MNANDLAVLSEAPPVDAIVSAGEAEILVGDVLGQIGSADAALHWRNAERLRSQAPGLRATYTVMQALCRLGDRDAASALASQLKVVGYAMPLSAAVTDMCGY